MAIQNSIRILVLIECFGIADIFGINEVKLVTTNKVSNIPSIYKNQIQ